MTHIPHDRGETLGLTEPASFPMPVERNGPDAHCSLPEGAMCDPTADVAHAGTDVENGKCPRELLAGNESCETVGHG